MTPEAQRIAIAEVCGRYVKGRFEWGEDRLPDYLNDLNAMHEAESTLDDGVLWHGYLNRLWDIVCPQYNQMSGLNAAIGLLLVHATAAQRAEAFLRTLKLWKD